MARALVPVITEDGQRLPPIPVFFQRQVSCSDGHVALMMQKALSEGGEICLHTEDGEQRILRGGCDWGPDAVDGDHLWCPTSVSGDFCYVREQDCTRQGPRMKCSACKIIAHAGCIQHLMEKVRFTCKPTFRDVGVRAYREQTAIHHHWVHRRSQKGKCKHCGKSFQSKLSFSSKEIVAIGCSWCKAAYHNKTSCFGLHRIEEQCNLGLHGSIIVPPSWIVKLPPKGNFKSSLRKPTKKKSSSKKKKEKVSPSASASGIETGSGQGCDTNGRNVREEQKEKVNKFFAIKPIPSTKLKPVLIFINPKSGGNQGLKLMQKFQWLLNPRQVFDLTQGGPSAGLDLFRKVPNLRILACGGDGTVGWIFSELDKMGIEPPPPVGVLPLGTGNDLARALGWGGGYTDEPISKILCHIEEGDIVQLDRWTLKVEPNPEACVESQKSCGGDAAFDDGEVKDSPPLNVVNNYFSIGVDAHIALEFHEAREAHPEKFNSRIRNKMFYGQMGGKDLLQRKWKDLTDYVSLECDGKDFTSKIREHKFHALLFLNIPSYGGGTRPWNNACGKQQTDDGRLEVIGLTTYQLPLLQAGGHGTCISQCQTAKVVTRKTIPMQVDGEACRVKPSIINLSVLNKAHVVTKRRGRTSHHDGVCLTPDNENPVKKHAKDDQQLDWRPRDSGVCVFCRRGSLPSSTADVGPQLRVSTDPAGGGGGLDPLDHPLHHRPFHMPFCKVCERSNSDSLVLTAVRRDRQLTAVRPRRPSSSSSSSATTDESGDGGGAGSGPDEPCEESDVSAVSRNDDDDEDGDEDEDEDGGSEASSSDSAASPERPSTPSSVAMTN